MKDKLATASVLAFERKLDPSDATFHAGAWESRATSHTWEPIVIREKSVRGTIGNRLKSKDQEPSRLDAAIEAPNLQTVDVATLPPYCDTLKLEFTLRVLPGAGVPAACNSVNYKSRLQTVVQAYVGEHGFAVLARRYATNLANGRFLWRNRVGAQSAEVVVELLQESQALKSWTFDALTISLRDMDRPAGKNKSLKELGQTIADGLAGDSHVLLRVRAFVRQGAGQEIFPSQALILNKESSGKSRTLYDIDGVAAMHSQKIGNALRTIDTWYEGASELGPIPVEPYGSVTTLGKAFRQPRSKLDFYSLLDGWVLHDKTPPTEQQHYVMAVLIRGGVFGDAS